jgi:hypothetical protein
MPALFAFIFLAASEDILSARDCAEVFGDESAVSENRELRERRLNFIIDSGEDVLLDHSHRWADPKPVEIRSLEVIETSTDASTAWVEFYPSQEQIECEDGVYALSVDDSLGPDGRVLAVLRDALLIELDGELWYALPEDGVAPDFRLAWSSRFVLPRTTKLSRPAPVKRRRRR